MNALDINEKKMSFNEFKKKIEKEMINSILIYVYKGILPNNNLNSYINAYSLAQTYIDYGDKQIKELTQYYNELLIDFIKECNKKMSPQLSYIQYINLFIEKTEKINFLIYWLGRIFNYFNRYCEITKEKNALKRRGLDIYRDVYFVDKQDKLYEEVNKLILEDRNCNLEHRHQIKVIFKIISDLNLKYPKIIKEQNKILWISENEKEEKKEDNIFGKNWFNTFKNQTIKYAKDKANMDINNMSAPEYIESQLKYIEEENIRQWEYINLIYMNDINVLNYPYLIGEKADDLGKMDTGITYMFNNKKNEEIKKAYELIKLYPDKLYVIMNSFSPYIKKRGEEINENKDISKDPKKLIPELIKFKKDMDDLVINCFNNNILFKNTENKAFSTFMKKEFYSKQLSNYTDYCMKTGFKGKSEEEVERGLNEIIDLFKCLNSKDVFILEANKKMSERLIKKKTISMNYEKLFISKLKQEQGPIFVSKMTQMINDLDKNKKEIDIYKSMPHRGSPNGIKFNVQIVSQSAWEINMSSMEKIEIPKFLNICLEDFTNFYLGKHNGQKLIWCLNLSVIEMQYMCFERNYFSTSTLPQFLSLLLLEKYNKLSLVQISNILGCNINTILNDITGLVYNPSFNPQGQKDKGLILGNFDETKKEFKETDEISINIKFFNQRQKFQTFPLVLKKSALEQKKIELEEANIIKNYQNNNIQATLTRIMKSRIGQKTTHIWIINEVSKQIDLFKAQPQQIKENIEKLIERGVIKRNEEDRTCYDYVA